MKIRLVAFATLILAPMSAHAQTADRVDPQTGNYVPQIDPFMRDAPDGDEPNPNRLDNRQSRHGSVRVGEQPSTAPLGAGDPQASASSAPSLPAPSPAVTQPLVSMGDMAMYTRPGEADTATDDPFAKPDWWPQ